MDWLPRCVHQMLHHVFLLSSDNIDTVVRRKRRGERFIIVIIWVILDITNPGPSIPVGSGLSSPISCKHFSKHSRNIPDLEPKFSSLPTPLPKHDFAQRTSIPSFIPSPHLSNTSPHCAYTVLTPTQITVVSNPIENLPVQLLYLSNTFSISPIQSSAIYLTSAYKKLPSPFHFLSYSKVTLAGVLSRLCLERLQVQAYLRIGR